jgi:hypothetical protein
MFFNTVLRLLGAVFWFQADVQRAFDLGEGVALGIDNVVFQYGKVFVAIGTGLLDGGNLVLIQRHSK